MYDPVIDYVRQARKWPRRSAKTSARRAAKAQHKRRADQAALYRRLQNHDPREPRPELLAAAKHDAPVEVPALTLTPSPAFVMSTLAIVDPDDIRQFADRCLGEKHLPGVPLRSFCPFHPDLDESALTLVEYRASSGAVPLVHCRRCGYALPLLDFVAEVGAGKEPTMAMAALTWPEMVLHGITDETVIAALCQQRMRRAILGAARWWYASLVVEDGVRPAFGDWAALPDASLRTLLAHETIPPEFRQDVYLLSILRNRMGELVAVDVYAPEDYRPLFRHWLVAGHDEPLFAVPSWGTCCGPTQTRDLVRNAAEGHALELEASRQPAESRQSIWLRIESPPLHGFLAPSEP